MTSISTMILIIMTNIFIIQAFQQQQQQQQQQYHQQKYGGKPKFVKSSHKLTSPLFRFYKPFYYRIQHSPRSILYSTDNDDDDDDNKIMIYNGPILPPEQETDIQAGVHLAQLGIDLVIAPSIIAPGSLGLFMMVSPPEDDDDDDFSSSSHMEENMVNVNSVTIPAFTLLSGYSKEGTFQSIDQGDKTVGFSVYAQTAVFFEQQLMSVLDALTLAAQTYGNNGSCGLAGHVLMQEEEESEESHHGEEEKEGGGVISVYPDLQNTEFKRFFVPQFLNSDNNNNDDVNDDVNDEEEDDETTPLTIQNFGQFCNDLAWNMEQPPSTQEIYNQQSDEKNVVQLVWRLEFDPTTNSLIPSWPVSVCSKDITFQNNNVYMELGTKYGWNYWQGTMFLNNDNEGSDVS